MLGDIFHLLFSVQQTYFLYKFSPLQSKPSKKNRRNRGRGGRGQCPLPVTRNLRK